MTPLAQILAGISLGIDILTSMSKAAQLISKKQERGGDYTPEEQKQVDDAVEASRLFRDASIAQLEAAERAASSPDPSDPARG